jgi:hypothetical protein
MKPNSVRQYSIKIIDNGTFNALTGEKTLKNSRIAVGTILCFRSFAISRIVNVFRLIE